MEKYHTAKKFNSTQMAQQAIQDFIQKVKQKTHAHNNHLTFDISENIFLINVPIIVDGKETQTLKNGIGGNLINSSMKTNFKTIFPEHNWKDIQNANFRLTIFIEQKEQYFQINYSSTVDFTTKEQVHDAFKVHQNWLLTEEEYNQLTGS